MKRIKQIIIFLSCITALITNITCTSVGTYAKNRGNDFLDMFKVKAGLGLGLHTDVKATDLVHIGVGGSILIDAGIRGRDLIIGGTDMNLNFPIPQILGSDLLLTGTGTGIFPCKSLLITHIHGELDDFPPTHCATIKNVEGDLCFLSPLLMGNDSWNKRGKYKPWYRRFDVEAGATVGIIGGRVGFSPGELSDFVLGIFTIDFAKDDKNNSP